MMKKLRMMLFMGALAMTLVACGGNQETPDGGNEGQKVENTKAPEPTKGTETPATTAPTKEPEATVTPAGTVQNPEKEPTAAPTEEPVEEKRNVSYEIKDNVITFKQIANDSVYYISGKFKGNIVIDVGDEYKFDLEFRGFSIIAEKTNPILVLSGNEVTITAKKDYENYIYDEREAIDETDEALYSSAIHSQVDLEIAGKGCLNVVSKNNNGIQNRQ